MFLTRIDIDTYRRESKRILASPHLMHGAVNSCFPPSQQPSRPLWRLDQTRQGTFLYLLSDVPPDPTRFVEVHGWPQAQAWVTRDYRPALEAAAAERTFGFRVRVNPVYSPRPAETQQRGKRLAHVTAEQQLTWFATRAPSWGFMLGEAEQPSATVVDKKVWKFGRAGRQVTVAMTAIEGVLTVTDPERFRQALVNGIGPAKAYGCGLMTLAMPN